MKRLILVIGIVFLVNIAWAQEMFVAQYFPEYPENYGNEKDTKESMSKAESQFEFSRVSHSDELSKMENISGGYFCNEVEKKYRLLNQAYAYDVPQVPGSLNTKTVIQKPVIYSAITKLYRYYKTETKKENLNKVLAEKEFSYILDVGLSVLYYDTESFEKKLKEVKKPEEISLFLQSVQLTD